MDVAEDHVNDAVAQWSSYAEMDEAKAEGFFDFGRDVITTFAVIYTLFTIFYIVMVVLTGMYWNSVPDTQNSRRVNAY